MIEKTSWFQLQPLYRYIRQQAENKKFYKYLEIGATFSLVAIFLFTAITPTAMAISKLIGEIKSKEITTKNMKNKIASIIQAQENYSLIQEKYDTLESSYPSSQKFFKSASTYTAISKESNTELNNLGFSLSESTSEKLNSQNSFIVSFTVSGQYSSLLDVIKKVTNNRRLTEIKSIQISPSGGKEGSGDSLNLNISTGLFYLPISSNE
jgi:hypothetical protein